MAKNDAWPYKPGMKKINIFNMLRVFLLGFSLPTLGLFSLDPELVEANHRLIQRPLSQSYLSNYIVKNSSYYKESLLEAYELAQKIQDTSYCLGIDPFVFTALIHKESGHKISESFDPFATSPTGAKGLTQMTSIAIAEVNRLLGHKANYRFRKRTKKAQTSKATIKSLETPLKKCLWVAYSLAGLDPQRSWVHLWKRNPLAARNDVYSKNWNKTSRELFLGDVDLSLIYGGILLKRFLVESSREEETQESMKSVYLKALENYNGSKNKKNYAKQVLSMAKLIAQNQNHFFP